MAARTHTKWGAGPGEIALYQVLASVAPACNDTFTTVRLPAAITIDPGRRLLVLPHNDGDDLAGSRGCHAWPAIDAANGGEVADT